MSLAEAVAFKNRVRSRSQSRTRNQNRQDEVEHDDEDDGDSCFYDQASSSGDLMGNRGMNRKRSSGEIQDENESRMKHLERVQESQVNIFGYEFYAEKISYNF